MYSSSSFSWSNRSSSSHSHSMSSLSSNPADDPGDNQPPEKTEKCKPKYASKNPIRYFNGEALLSETDISGVLGGFVHRHSYGNQLAAMYDGPNGNNWLMPDWPYLVKSGTDVLYANGHSRVWFNSSLDARYGEDDLYSLTDDSSNETYTLTVIGRGVKTCVFHDFDQSNHPTGFLKEMKDAYYNDSNSDLGVSLKISTGNAGDGMAIWDRLCQYVIKKQPVELIRRYGSNPKQYFIEARCCKSVHDHKPGSNRVDASSGTDY